jgi:anaerobic selenocysteine-containing dehydrogenase
MTTIHCTTHKLSAHCNLLTQNNPYLMEIQARTAEINPVDAAKYGVRDNTYVVLSRLPPALPSRVGRRRYLPRW